MCHLSGNWPELSLILNQNFHIFSLSESRLNYTISDDHILIKSVNVVRRDPNLTQETGIAADFGDSLNVYLRHDLETSVIECIWVQINLQNHNPIVVGYLYQNQVQEEPAATNSRL